MRLRWDTVGKKPKELLEKFAVPLRRKTLIFFDRGSPPLGTTTKNELDLPQVFPGKVAPAFSVGHGSVPFCSGASSMCKACIPTALRDVYFFRQGTWTRTRK